MVTIEEVQKAIQSGECKKIYLCSKTLWWTHDAKDLVKGKCPKGWPVNVNTDPKKFMNQTNKAPNGWYGKHDLKAFMKAHAQNCNGHFHNTWIMYNKLIDKENGETNLKIV